MSQNSLENLLSKVIACHGICIDSRKWQEGECFFALTSSKVSGNTFAADLLAKGAPLVVVDDTSMAASVDERVVLVPNVLKALQDISHLYRQRFDIPVFAITGSNGKTSTKELLMQVMSKRFKTHCTKGNLNNHIGVPLTLLAMPLDTDFAIIEMGANAVGDIWELCSIASPNYGLITNVGKAHLEGFGSFEGVIKAKSELYRYLNQNDGTVFVNKDEPNLKENLPEGIKVTFYHNDEILAPHSKDLKLVTEHPSIHYEFRDAELKCSGTSPLFGKYNFRNIEAAFSVGRYFDVETAKIKEAIQTYRPDNNRSQILQVDKLTLVLDAYNANPSSMALSIESFAQREGQKMLILGEMMELGEDSSLEHELIVHRLMKDQWQWVIFIGQGFAKVPLQNSWFYLERTADALDLLSKLRPLEGTLLLKGSRSVGLEALIPFLTGRNDALR